VLASPGRMSASPGCRRPAWVARVEALGEGFDPSRSLGRTSTSRGGWTPRGGGSDTTRTSWLGMTTAPRCATGSAAKPSTAPGPRSSPPVTVPRWRLPCSRRSVLRQRSRLLAQRRWSTPVMAVLSRRHGLAPVADPWQVRAPVASGERADLARDLGQSRPAHAPPAPPLVAARCGWGTGRHGRRGARGGSVHPRRTPRTK
jgi:hypothetical protein